MSTYQPKPNTWTLFANKYKKDETHPDYSGTALIELPDGTTAEFRLTAWKRNTKNNVKFIGGFIKPKEAQKTLLPADDSEKEHEWE